MLPILWVLLGLGIIDHNQRPLTGEGSLVVCGVEYTSQNVVFWFILRDTCEALISSMVNVEQNAILVPNIPSRPWQ
ncbi:hypothetical protein BO71DRAFT_190266 [Aspergillus ellipticus CBS 707.79]|uniref:Secreted protein n=1 Tax=Aspergillus ellipticus CBS 707.79 TaxID=1448320 RepID=A0A319DFC2_9EURO|nr:hypothetical protein BO71DRAFT_190266 [Aspergillus ellipticus CBS 707.79]